ADTTNANFSRRSNWNRAHGIVQNMHLRIGNRPADWRQSVFRPLGRNQPRRRDYCTLRWAVIIDEKEWDIRQRVSVQRVSARKHNPQNCLCGPTQREEALSHGCWHKTDRDPLVEKPSLEN